MTFYRIEDRHIPLDGLELVRLDRNATGFGYFIPQHSQIGHSLIEGDGKSLIIIPLDGNKAFRHFSIEMGSPIRGVLFRDVNLAVDLRSGFNCRAAEHLGAITVSGGKTCLTTSPLHDGFGDTMPFPLPLDAIGDDDAPIGFRQWSITKRIGDDIVELWKTPVPERD
ncbi:hypothetical protein OVA07_01025 [Novosphingobium sp. SL115]|uniref:hypothetical protein n=1 Tax=Novosphingobium sp. SL115 TaxID=2995150 RepID=UPI0022758D2D|nr:hypothetical protein [Novosphingobium sp. SL115]MCY1669594.1 hypothetical protein [Novosphingobium sp. SL115]